MPPNFPDKIWDGTSSTRSSTLVDKSPDYIDWDQIVSEVIAMQVFMGDIASFPGTVVSVDILPPSDLLVPSGNPIEDFGIITLSKVPQAANTFYCGPTSGDDNDPEFRTISSLDLPIMVGANGSDAGVAGIVPAPAPTDNIKFLRGDGTYAEATGGGDLNNNVIPLFDNYVDVGNNAITETDLYSDTIAADTLVSDGDKIKAIYAGSFSASANNKKLKIYFAGILIFDSGDLEITIAIDWILDILIIRTSSTTARTISKLSISGI